jgi:purine nucleoside permease
MTECEDQSIAYALHCSGTPTGWIPAATLSCARRATTPSRRQQRASSHNLLSGEESGTALAVESAYRVGSPVVHALVQHWDLYQGTLPGADSP